MAYSRTTWVDGSTPAIDAANLNNIETGILGVETTANAAVPKSTVTTNGDLIVATGSGVVSRLAVGAAGTVLKGGMTPSYDFPPGYQWDRKTITAPVTITATTEGTANAVAIGNLITYDGTEVKVEFFTPYSAPAAGQNMIYVVLYDSTVLGQVLMSGADAIKLEVFHTPAAGAHTYKVSAFTTSGTGTVYAGLGGSGAYPASVLRVTKA